MFPDSGRNEQPVSALLVACRGSILSQMRFAVGTNGTNAVVTNYFGPIPPSTTVLVDPPARKAYSFANLQLTTLNLDTMFQSATLLPSAVAGSAYFFVSPPGSILIVG